MKNSVLVRGCLAMVAAACLFELGGCKRSGKASDGSEVVAKVGGDSITAKEFKARLGEQSPLIQARYSSLDKKKEFLDNLIRMEVLTQEARKRGLEKDPEVQSTLAKIMVQKLLRQQYENASKSIPEGELRSYYKEHMNEFVRPERVRASEIFLAAPKSSPTRQKVQAEASKLLVEIKGKEAGPNRMAFSQAAQSRSNDSANQSSGGDLGFRTQDELTQQFGPQLASAVFAMKMVGEVSGPIATDKGFYLLKLEGRQPGVDQSFEAVRPRIEARMTSERRSKSVDNFIADLKSKANIKVNDDALNRVEVKPEGSTQLGASGMPGAPPRP